MSPQFHVSNSSCGSAEQHTLFFSTPWFGWIVLDYIGEFVFSIFISQLAGIWCFFFFFYLEENKLCKPQLSFLINVLQIRLKAWPSCSVTPNLPGMQTAKTLSVSGWGFWRVPTPQTLPCQRGIPVFNKVTQTPFVFTQRARWIPHTHLSLKTLSNTYTKTQYTD